MIQVKSFYAFNDLRNFSYVVFDDASGAAWAIDPFEATPLTEFIRKQGLDLRGILNTHQHWDHIRGNEGLQSVFHCELCACRAGSEIGVGDGHALRILSTPGHTSDHKAFQWVRNGEPLALFSGDTLFNSGVGNCRNGGNVEDLFRTTQQLLTLPDETILYPGHDYLLRNLAFAQFCEPENRDIAEALRLVKGMATEENLGWTLGQEKKVNPFLRLGSEQIRNTVLKTVAEGREGERTLFIKLRELRDTW